MCHEIWFIMRPPEQQLLGCHGAARPVSVAVYGNNFIPPVKSRAGARVEVKRADADVVQELAIPNHLVPGDEHVIAARCPSQCHARAPSPSLAFQPCLAGSGGRRVIGATSGGAVEVQRSEEHTAEL